MRFPPLRIIHKWISLSFVLLWILQAGSGLAISFRADIDDFFLGQTATRSVPSEIARTVQQMQDNGDDISSFWISGGVEGQYDIYLTRSGVDRTARINGHGELIRDRADTVLFSDGAVFETLTRFHKSLMLGTTGYIILFLSGLLLASNIGLGLCAGWSKRRRLKAFTTNSNVPKSAVLSGWHWRAGFWGALPALCVVLAGTALTQSDILAENLGVTQNEPEKTDKAINETIDLEKAITAALAEYPGATVTAVNLPTAEKQWYKFRLNTPAEMPRLYGATRVFIGLDGRVLLKHDAANSAANERVIEALYPMHTGQIGGAFGRLINMLVGLWMLAMAYIGVRLWLSRRRISQGKTPTT